MIKYSGIYESSTPPSSTKALWVDGGVLKIYKNGSWRPVDDPKSKLTIDSSVKEGSTNPVSGGAVHTALMEKADSSKVEAVKDNLEALAIKTDKIGTLRDLYISAGAKYNEATGFYELNGLTDITEEEMRVIWQEDLSGWYLKGRTNLTRNIKTRSNAGGYNVGIDISNMCANNNNITIFNFGSSPFARYLDNAFSGCTKLETIDTRFPINPYGGVVGPNIFRDCPALEEVRFNMGHLQWSTNVNFPASPLISKDSVLSVIQTTPTTGSVKPLVVVGLNETAYNRLKDDTDIQQALTEKNGFVTLTQI